jgi:hypothetical protein
MKKYIAPLLLILATTNIPSAKEYESFYGFSINVPEHWLVLTRSELKENSDLFDSERADFGTIDKNLLKQAIAKIQNGNTELYINQNTSDLTFSDNINIMKQAGEIPEDNKELKKQCNELNTQLSEYFGRPIKLYQCEMTAINNMKVFFAEFDGAISGTRSIQYQFQKSPSILILITATCKNETSDIIRQEFKEMIDTIKFR